jgi:hypothetical protein
VKIYSQPGSLSKHIQDCFQPVYRRNVTSQDHQGVIGVLENWTGSITVEGMTKEGVRLDHSLENIINEQK